VMLATAFGFHGMYVDKSRDLAGALQEAFSVDKPVLLALPIDYRENDRLTEQLQIIS